jgi:hypothetical protein
LAADKEEVMRRAIVILLLVAAACSSKPSAAPSSSSTLAQLPTFVDGAQYHPTINPADFSANVTNPWFPLTPGKRLIYQGTKDGIAAREIVTPTDKTKIIAGVECRVVHDELYQKGRLVERTDDYYTQDSAGNVWYFGEDTAELDASGKVTSTEGSWLTGVDGAQPGVFMQANPVIGQRFRQEYLKGHAEDTFKVVSLSASITVPYGSISNALKTEETTRLEPDVIDHKLYARGVGEVWEGSVSGDERLELVQVQG